ncbi:hypothetical protein IKE71_01130 [Candidatus Saccharibacteria bacterium]|nr:hypothetical protein [Candidatus Saccharibacteria bacterium]
MVKKSSSAVNAEIVNWEAEEYVWREKKAGWYIGFAVVAVILVALSVYLRWWTFTALVVFSAVALIIYSVRPPRKLRYSLSSKGLLEGNNLYKYEDYRSFGILQEGENFAIVLRPRRRFSLQVTVFFPKESGEEIVDAFGARLPMEEVQPDFLDKVVRLLRI